MDEKKLVIGVDLGTDDGARSGIIEAIGKRYDYEGVPGRIKVDGVEVDVASLSEAEKITAGEQLMKRHSQETGRPVSELREDLAKVAAAHRKTERAKPKRHLQLVGQGNRHERRKLAAIERRK